MDNLFHVTSLIFLLSIVSFCSAPRSFAVPTVAISETGNYTLICAVVTVWNGRDSFLNCSSFSSGVQVPESRRMAWSGIVAGDGFLCALANIRASSTMVCWRFNASGIIRPYKRIYQGRALSELEAGNSQVCSIVDGTDRIECWGPRQSNNADFKGIAVGGDFVCGLSEFGEIRCLGENAYQMPKGIYTAIAAGISHVCAINSSNDLVCAGNMTGESPHGKFTSMALGENRSCALQTNDRVVCWGGDNFSLPKSLRETDFISIEAKRNVFCGVVKLNFSLFCWGSEHLNRNSVVFKEVMPGQCRRTSLCTCGPLAGTGNFCNEGYSICEKCENRCTLFNTTTPSPTPAGRSDGDRWDGKIVAFFVVGCVGVLSFLSIFSFFFFRDCKCRGCRVHDSGRRDESNHLEQGISRNENSQARRIPSMLEKRLSQLTSMGNAGHLEEYSLRVLLEATNNFSEDHRIGVGSFGSIYHGILEDGSEVAVKRAEASTSTHPVVIKRREDNDDAFINELESLSRLHHKNLVRLLGFCEDCNERVLVYEYMHNGTLHDHLHKLQNSPLMSWPARIKVALDAARGIEYLHEYAVPQIIHRDIKSSNILLDESWTARVSDFGLSLMGPQDGESHLSLQAAGTVGYIDPEYYRLHILTTKSDVYSFGVLLLELLSGQKAIHKNENGDPRNVVDFMVPHVVRDDIHRVLDIRVPPPTPFEIEAILYVGYLAADCVILDSVDRPTMPEIVDRLERALAACLVNPSSLSRTTTESST